MAGSINIAGPGQIYEEADGTRSMIVRIAGAVAASSGVQTEDAAAASADAGVPAMAVQTASPADAATAGDYAMLQMAGGQLWAQRAPSSTAAAAIVSVVSTALETGHVIKASAGNLYGLNMQATTVAGIFLLHNSATVPAAGAVTPVKAYPVGIGQAIDVTFDPPLRLGTGISVSFTSSTTTPFTQTDSATAFISGDAV